MTDQHAIYSRFEALEENLAHCYFLLQERFIGTPALARFWGEAALDELQHAAILRYCRRHRLIRLGSIVNSDTANQVDKTLGRIKRIVADSNLTVNDAFFAALLIESSELDQAYERLTQPLSKERPTLYQAIRTSLQAHQHKFAEAAAEFMTNSCYAESFRTRTLVSADVRKPQ